MSQTYVILSFGPVILWPPPPPQFSFSAVAVTRDMQAKAVTRDENATAVTRDEQAKAVTRGSS